MYTLLASRYLSSFLFYFIDPQRSLPPFALHFRRRPSWLSAKFSFADLMYTLFNLHSLMLGFFLLITVFYPFCLTNAPRGLDLTSHRVPLLSLLAFESLISPPPQQTLFHLVGYDFHFSLILILETSRASSICIHVSIPMSQFLVPFIVSSTQTSRSLVACNVYVHCTMVARAVHKKRSSFTIQLKCLINVKKKKKVRIIKSVQLAVYFMLSAKVVSSGRSHSEYYKLALQSQA